MTLTFRLDLDEPACKDRLVHKLLFDHITHWTICSAWITKVVDNNKDDEGNQEEHPACKNW